MELLNTMFNFLVNTLFNQGAKFPARRSAEVEAVNAGEKKPRLAGLNGSGKKLETAT
jgi:hypothetical protein